MGAPPSTRGYGVECGLFKRVRNMSNGILEAVFCVLKNSLFASRALPGDMACHQTLELVCEALRNTIFAPQKDQDTSWVSSMGCRN